VRREGEGGGGGERKEGRRPKVGKVAGKEKNKNKNKKL